MAEYIERAPLLEALKAKHCEDCPGGYARTKCKTWCDAADNIALVEDAPEVSPYEQWIDVQDKLPEEYQSVLGVANGVDVRIVHYALGGFWMEDTTGEEYDVTYWMPLPKPPEALR